MNDDVRNNLANTDNWIKALLILVYGLIFYVAIWVLGLIILINLVVLLVTGRRNENLADFGKQTADYLSQIMAFCTLNSEVHPFPFGEWPDADDDGGEASAPPAAPESEKTDSKAAGDSAPASTGKKKSTRKKTKRSSKKKKTTRKR